MGVCRCNQPRIKVELKGITATCQVLQLTVGFPSIRSFRIELDPEDLLEVDLAANSSNFRFPISFASDMSQISILRTLYREDSPGNLERQRLIPAPARLEFHDCDPMRACYRRLFSPCGRFLVHLERRHDFNDSPEGHWSLTIWEREAPDARVTTGLFWQQIASLSDNYGNHLVEGSVRFNPQYQIVAFMERVPNQTSIWNFRTTPVGSCGVRQATRNVYATGLRNLNFSPCGRFL